jgi:hypothetical protein
MILDAEQRQGFVTEAFQRLVIQIDVGDFHFGLGQRIDSDGETVILSCDLHLPGWHSQDRMVATAVPEFQLVSSASQRQT